MTISRREFLKRSVVSASSLLTGMPLHRTVRCNTSLKKSKPNIILVMTDDQGYGDLACHGNAIIQTPNLDKLHANSVRLTDFHVSPVCTPTRAALMTGCDAVRTGAWGTTWGRSMPRKEFVTMAGVFAANGYRTGHFGKWHLGDNYPFRPEDRGFEEVLRHGGGGVGQTPDYWGNDYFDDAYFRSGGKPEKSFGYCTDVWFDNALKFIEENKDRPFFCYLPTNAPHSPYIVGQKYRNLYKDNPKVPVDAFYGMITNIDENMGRLMARLKELGLGDNTILIFLTDNGTAAGYLNGKGFNSGMRGTKGSIYDGGHRVPCFIRWPNGNLIGGRDINELSAHIDILPTLIDLCGLKAIPEATKFDGISLAPVLTQHKKTLPERTIIVQYSQTTTPPPKWEAAVLRQKWRLVKGKELYNIEVDPGQKKDLSKDYPEIVSQLRVGYEKWWDQVSRTFGEESCIIIGSDHENPACLNGFDWHTSTPWNQEHILGAAEMNGYWAIDVGRAGTYEFELRRWPKELDLPINEAPKNGKMIDAQKARLRVGDVDVSQEIPAGAVASKFKVELPTGKTHLQTWFLDSHNNDICGAYYVFVKR